MEINIHQILVIWGCGDSYGQDPPDPRVLFHPCWPAGSAADTKLTTKQNTGQSIRVAGCENLVVEKLCLDFCQNLIS